MSLNEQMAAAGVDVKHHFVGGLYAKETHIPAGVRLIQHAHSFDHLSALMAGVAIVEIDGACTTHHAPALLTIKAHVTHEVLAKTDVVWACLHATEVTDADLVDAELMGVAA